LEHLQQSENGNTSVQSPYQNKFKRSYDHLSNITYCCLCLINSFILNINVTKKKSVLTHLCPVPLPKLRSCDDLVNVYSLRFCDDIVLSTPINIWVQLRTNNYQHVPTKKIGLRTYCVCAFTRSSHVRHNSKYCFERKF
jgi:hypothetical protein